MAREFSNISLLPTRWAIVRWIGAYRRAGGNSLLAGVVNSLRHEVAIAARGDEVACAVMALPLLPNERVGGAMIGLLIAPRESDIISVYRDDAWTEVDEEVSARAGHRSLRNTREQKITLKRAVDLLFSEFSISSRPYCEAVVGRREIIGVIVHPNAPRRVRMLARKAAQRAGLPYIGSLSRKNLVRLNRREVAREE